MVRVLLKERQHALGLLVGLREHGGGSLLNNLRLRQLRGGSGIVGVHDRASRGLDVAGDVSQVIGCVGHLVDAGTDLGALGIYQAYRCV